MCLLGLFYSVSCLIWKKDVCERHFKSHKINKPIIKISPLLHNLYLHNLILSIQNIFHSLFPIYSRKLGEYALRTIVRIWIRIYIFMWYLQLNRNTSFWWKWLMLKSSRTAQTLVLDWKSNVNSFSNQLIYHLRFNSGGKKCV